MELKRKFTLCIAEALNSFNRTFMELKRKFTLCIAEALNSFNRTFMELKLSSNAN